MSATKVHVLIPGGISSACGIHLPHQTAMYREQITCKWCKNSNHYKGLQSLPKAKR